MTFRVHSPTTAALAGLLALFVVSCGSAAAQPVSAPARTAAPVAATTSQPEAPITALSPVATVAPLATEAPASVAPSEAPAAQTPAPSVALATAAPTAAPASTPAPTVEPKTGPIAVSLTDIAIKLDQGWTSAGPVTFSIRNVGTVGHQLVVLKTDIPQNQIPVSTTSPGTVTQPGFVGTTAVINPGGSATLTLPLTSGNYVLLCNQPAHYLIGMHTGFKVN